ncbi:hypothetical protein CMO84_00275 [Candidatus Woesearchaeota archaeon]|nr:hypothetical protein [Candidatus Woesearchaeota archaeon]
MLVAATGASAMAPATVQASDGLANEWRARRWALTPEVHRVAITEALGSKDWSAVYGALDALARDERSARWGLALLSDGGGLPSNLLSHPHPNVRARALDLCTLARRGLDPESPLARALAEDTLERVRHALVRHLAWTAQPEERSDLLLQLAQESDEAAQAAQRLLYSSGPAAWPQQLKGLADESEGLEVALLKHLEELQRAPVSVDLIRGLRALVREESAAGVLVEGLALHGELDGAAVRADRERMVRGWFLLSPDPKGDLDGSLGLERRRQTHALRTGWAREGDVGLGRILFRAGVELAQRESRPGSADDPAPEFTGHLRGAEEFLGASGQGASFLLECAGESLPVGEVLRSSALLTDELAEEVWSQVGARTDTMDEDSDWEGLQWVLAPARSRSLRWTAAAVIAETWVDQGLAGVVEEMLFGLLEDPDRDLRRRSFRWLCDAPGFARRVERLHGCWRRFVAEERLLHLRSLPRKQAAGPFLPDLLELCAMPSGRTPPVLELLGPFREREEVRATLESWHEEALVELEQADSGPSYRAAQWRGKAIALALGSRSAGNLKEGLVRVIASPPGPDFFVEATLPYDPEWSKTLAGLLAKSAEGRRDLLRFLGPATPRRVRVEAGIGLVAHGEGARIAEGVLFKDYPGCDVDLGMRVLEALGASDSNDARSFLVDVVLDADDAMERRLAAQDALARTEDLQEILLRTQQPELILNAVSALGARAEAGESGVGELLFIALARVESRVGSDRERASDGQVAGELLLACIRSGAGGSALERRAFAGALEASGADLKERFRGLRPAATEFRFRLELTAAEALAKRGRLGGALTDAGDWERLDGRLLFELAQLDARGEWGSALLRAARVALQGEPVGTDTVGLLDRVVWLGYRLGVERGDWAGVGESVSWLLLETLLRGSRSQGFGERLGRFDRRSGVDPFADLGAAALQARGWEALAQGDRSRARALAAQAQVWLGGSDKARAGQAELMEAVAR